MNLVLSGPIDSALLALVERLSRPTAVTPVRQHAWRLEEVDDSLKTRRAVADYCDSAAVDHAYVKANVRFSDMKLLVLDMDSTLITIECIDELADFAGKKAEVAAITEATMRGDIKDFTESLRERVALLQGLDVDLLRRVYDERLHLSPGAQTLIDAAHDRGIYILLVSGGFTYFADRLKEALSINAAFANQLEVRNGRLTGHVVGTIVNASLKAEHVQQAMRLTRCTSAQAVAIGDGANDIPMMECVEHSIAYRAKPNVRALASMTINFGSLDATLDYL